RPSPGGCPCARAVLSGAPRHRDPGPVIWGRRTPEARRRACPEGRQPVFVRAPPLAIQSRPVRNHFILAAPCSNAAPFEERGNPAIRQLRVLTGPPTIRKSTRFFT